MIPYLKLAIGAGLMAAGAALCYWMYASPRIDSLKSQIAQIQTADALRTAQFFKEAKDREDALIASRDAIAAQYAANQAKSVADIARLNALAGGLRGTIACYASGNCGGLPKVPDSTQCIDARTEILAGLLSESVELVAEGAANARTAADQIAALQMLSK